MSTKLHSNLLADIEKMVKRRFDESKSLNEMPVDPALHRKYYIELMEKASEIDPWKVGAADDPWSAAAIGRVCYLKREAAKGDHGAKLELDRLKEKFSSSYSLYYT